MASRRNTYTAVFFLVGLLTAAVFLITGLFVVPKFHLPVRTYPAAWEWHTKLVEPEEEEEEEEPAHPEQVLAALGAEEAPEAEEQEEPFQPKGKGRDRTRDEAPPVRTLRTTHHTMQVHVAQPADRQVAPGEAFDAFTQTLGSRISDLLDRKHTFIELYGAVQRLMGRRVMEDADTQYTVVKLDNDTLMFSDPQDELRDMTTLGEEMSFFAKRVELRYRIPFLYVQVPSKLDLASLPQGMTNYTGQEADQFLSILEENGVDTLDLRPLFRQIAETDPDSARELFFHTDHHWTPLGAFLAFQAVCDVLRLDYDMDIDPRLTTMDAFERVKLEDFFLGSQGWRVGSQYAGLDDFELWLPTFSTSFTYYTSHDNGSRSGSFADTLLALSRLEQEDYYLSGLYSLYADGDMLLSRAINRDLPDGPRILVLRDSYGCAFTPFLSLVSGEVMAVDPRSFNADQEYMLDKYLRWLKPDMIIVLNSTGSLRSDTLFPYLPSTRQAVLDQREAAQAAP